MKNHILYSAFAALSFAAALTSCKFEQEDFFEESAALRIESTNADIKAKLCAASADGQYGWLIQYFVAGTDEMVFEGFNLYGRFFESGKVILSSDHRFLRNGNAGKFTEYTSYYEMLKEEGSVLAFNTWNDVLTVFVDPVDPSSAPNSIVDNGEGMKGDDRLVMVSYSDDEMVFRGERYGQEVRFLKLDCPAEEYCQKVKDCKNVIASTKINEYSISNGTETMYMTGLNNGYFDIVDRLDDPLFSTTKTCVFTTNGFRMQRPYNLGEDEYQEFVLNDDETALVCGNVQIRAEWQRAMSKLLLGNKAIVTEDGASPAFAELYNSLSQGVTTAYSTQTFSGISFGSSNESATNRRTGVVFNMRTKSNLYQLAYTANVEVKDGKLILVVDTADKSSNYNTYNKKGLGPQFDAMAEAINGTYTLTPDNPFRMNQVKAVKDSDPGFYFVINM